MAFRGWEVTYDDDTVIREGQIEWNEVKKNKIKILKLIFEHKAWQLAGKESYLQKKNASMIPGIQESFQIESRSIGFYEGSNKVWYTVDEYTGVMRVTVQEG